MVYGIYEENIERIRKKMLTIKNKCEKYGCEFRYEEVGEEYRNVAEEDGKISVRRFVLVDVEGTARVNDWEFIASVEHHDTGNIIRKIVDVEVPRRYYDSKVSLCEHCNKRLYRKKTCLIRNTNTGEFKQVGTTCLKDYTRGMSAEIVAIYVSAFEELIEGEAPSGGCYSGGRYFSVDEVMQVAAETVKKFGYEKVNDYNDACTRTRVSRYLDYFHGGLLPTVRDFTRDELSKVNFDCESDEIVKLANDVKTWILAKSEDNDYIHNCKAAASLEWVSYQHIGLLASTVYSYLRESERQAARKASEEKYKAEGQYSEFVGNVGAMVELTLASIYCLTSWESDWGITHVYKLTDGNNNVYTWKTGKYLDDENIGKVLRGKVKNHVIYRDVKQTELTNCRFKA